MLIIHLLTLILIFFTCVYVALCILWNQRKQYWAQRNVAHTPPHPVFGSLSFIRRENPAIWFRRIYDCLKKPYVGIWLFWRPALVINSEDIARNILIKDQANFRNRLASSGTSDPVGGLNLFTLNDPLWSVIRRRLSILFTSAKLRSVQNLMVQKSKELQVRIEKERQKSEPINIRAVFTDFTTDIIGTSSFGLASDSTVTGDSLLRSITREYTKYEIFRALSWCCIFFIPELVNVFRFKMFPMKQTELLRKMIRTAITQRGGYEKKVTEPRDLLDILIKLKQEEDKEQIITDNMILAQAASFLQGGFETSGLVLTFGIYELAFYPEVQDKLYKEIRQAKDEHAKEFLDGTILSQLKYLTCVINETLRKYPILVWLDRIALEDYKIDEHLTITAGTPVYINVIGMHYDLNLYPEPNKFNPDRFLLHENVNDVKSSTYMPFGDGPRICIGQRFGLETIRHGLAAIIMNYEVKPFPDSVKPSEITFASSTTFLNYEDTLHVEFIPRN